MTETVVASSDLKLDLSAMNVEDYTLLLVAMGDDDHWAVVQILDKYVEGGLKERPWGYFWIALLQADRQLENGKNTIKAAEAAAAFMRALQNPFDTP